MVLPCCNKRNVESSVVIIAEEEEEQRQQRRLRRSYKNNESTTTNKDNNDNNKVGDDPKKDNLKIKSNNSNNNNNNNTSSTRTRTRTRTRTSRPVPDSREEDTTEDDNDGWMEDVWLGRASSTCKAPQADCPFPSQGEESEKQQQRRRQKQSEKKRVEHRDNDDQHDEGHVAEAAELLKNTKTESQIMQQQDDIITITTTTKSKTTAKKKNKSPKSSSQEDDGIYGVPSSSSSPKRNNDKKSKATKVIVKSKSTIPVSPRNMGSRRIENGQKEGEEKKKNNDQLKIGCDDDAPTTTVIGGPSKSTIQQQQQQQRKSQLSKSIVSTFQELSKERPDQMEEEAIQRAMELSMLDVALVYYDNNNNNNKPAGEESKSSTSSSTTTNTTWFSSSSSIMSNAITISKQQQQQQQQNNNNNNNQLPSPYKILGISPNNATPDVIKAAYRKLARMHHPDKGGDSNKFQLIACAYRSLLSGKHNNNNNNNDDDSNNNNNNAKQQQYNLKGTAHWDKQLQDHRKLVQELFQANGININNLVTKQLTVLEMLALINYDVGSTNRNEHNELIRNSCFYLSLAASYLWGIGAICYETSTSSSSSSSSRNNIDDNNSNKMIMNEEDVLLVGETALQLKRTIEAAVVKAHPEWAVQGMVGEEVQAFSDFLVYTLDSQTLLSDWAVIVFDACSGYCDVYKGRNYNNNNKQKKKYNNGYFSNTSTIKDDKDEKWAQTNTITLRYIPGHYQPLIPSNKDAQRPSLETILSALDAAGVFYVVTDGNS